MRTRQPVACTGRFPFLVLTRHDYRHLESRHQTGIPPLVFDAQNSRVDFETKRLFAKIKMTRKKRNESVSQSVSQLLVENNKRPGTRHTTTQHKCQNYYNVPSAS